MRYPIVFVISLVLSGCAGFGGEMPLKISNRYSLSVFKAEAHQQKFSLSKNYRDLYDCFTSIDYRNPDMPIYAYQVNGRVIEGSKQAQWGITSRFGYYAFIEFSGRDPNTSEIQIFSVLMDSKGGVDIDIATLKSDLDSCSG